MNTFIPYNKIIKICRKIFIIFFLFLFLISTKLFAQNDSNNFSSFKLSLSLLKDRNNDPLINYFTPQTGIEGKVETPFYWGNIIVGVRSLSFKGKKPEYHNFSSKYYFFGWEKEIGIYKRLNLFLGFKVGGFSMSFSDDSLTIYQKDETELGAGTIAGIHLFLFSNIFLNTSFEYSRIFTHKRIVLFLISAGIAYKFNTPDWMKDLLK